MSTDRQNKRDIGNLLRRVLRDDLPPETEFRMRKRLAVFRRGVVSSEDRRVVRSAGWWGRSPALVQGLTRYRVFRKAVLAYVSAVMLAAGALIHLGGYQSLLANSISLLKESMSLAEQIRLAASMDCVIRMPAAGQPTATYHIRWARERGTRVDIASPRGIDEVRWINPGRVTIANFAAGLLPAAHPVPDLPEPVTALLAPADLARKMGGNWQLQPEKKQHSPDRLVFVDRRDGAVIEVRLDRKSFLPISLSWKPAKAGGDGRTGSVAATAELTWNQPVAPDLLVPRLEPGR
jgi:hypothetical protein